MALFQLGDNFSKWLVYVNYYTNSGKLNVFLGLISTIAFKAFSSSNSSRFQWSALMRVALMATLMKNFAIAGCNLLRLPHLLGKLHI
jgi:hypothetical protein